MDFLKQTNFRYIVIIIIIILAVINLYKINSQENFKDLLEDQNLAGHNVMIDSTDQVIFGDKTLTHKLTNIESGVLTLGTDLSGPESIVDGANGLHLKSSRDVFLMSPPGSVTRVTTAQGHSGKLVVEGRADFMADVGINGHFSSSFDSNEGGRISLMNPSKSLTNEVSNWTIYNMTGDYLPHGLHFWKYFNSTDANSTFVLTDDGNTLVKGELTVEKNTLVKGDLTFETDGPDGSTGGGISIINTEKTENNQAQKWTIYNFNNYNNSNGLSFWRYSNLGCTQEGMCAEHMTMNDDGTTVFKGGLTVDGSTLVRGNLTVDGIANGNAFINSSDRRLKENIENISQNDKDKVLQLVPKTYNMISDQNKKRYGLIAQEVEELYPELVNTNETDGMKSLNYIELIPLLLEQIKELKKSVEQIKTLINM